MNRDELIEKACRAFHGSGIWDEMSPEAQAMWMRYMAQGLEAVEPIIRADALSRFSITEFPNGKIQTLIADGTNWVTVSTANSMVDRARADERARAAAEVAEVVRLALLEEKP